MHFKFWLHETQCSATRQALSRSYGCFFAEFLEDLSLVRLGLLDLTTCVGLRYGLSIHNLRRFSWKRALQIFLSRSFGSKHCLNFCRSRSSTDFPIPHSYNTYTNPIMCFAYCTPSLHRNINKCGNINPLSIGCGYRHPLRPD